MPKWQIYFLLVLLMHLLLLLGISLRYGIQPKKEELAAIVPAYIYHGEDVIKGIVQNAPVKDMISQPIAQPQMEQKAEETVKEAPKIDETAITTTPQEAVKVSTVPKKRQPHPTPTPKKQALSQENNFAFSAEMNGQYQKTQEVNQPLLKLLYIATGEHLVYPRIAADFNQVGIVKIRFKIHPNGMITNIMKLKSSGYDFLDQAGLSAISDMSPVSNVDAYLSKPEFIEVNIVFH